MQQKTRSLAGLLLAIGLFLSLPVMLSAASTGHGSIGSQIVVGLATLVAVAGTTVLYTFPTNGGIAAFNGATAPTVVQASVFSSLSTKFQMLDAETSCTFTHNWNLSTTETNQFFPIPIIQGLANLGTAGGNSFSVAYGTGTIVLSKGNTTGSGGTFSCVMLRPNTLIR